MKSLFIFGTRPEAIKLAPLIIEFKNKFPHSTYVCVTAQHRGLLDQALDFFEIKPDFDLNLMQPNQSLNSLTSNLLSNLDPIVKEINPDIVFVQGDTTSVFCGALNAFYNNNKIAHIEAGLRSNDKHSPFPEEINRQLTSKLSDFHFTPTQTASENLIKENITQHIYEVGNTVIDALLIAKDKVSSNDAFYKNHFNKIDFSKKLILLTCHRRESFGDGIVNIFKAIIQIATQRQDIEFIYPVHPNPNVKKVAEEMLSNFSNIKLIEPLDYPYLIWLLTKVEFVLTDSGGIQEEAPTLGKPVLVLRDVTERTEGIEAGTAKLIGTETNIIIENCNLLLDNETIYNSMANASNPYGDGYTSKRILSILCEQLGFF